MDGPGESTRGTGGAATEERGTEERATDSIETSIGTAVDEEARRRDDYLDTLTAALTSLVTKESLANEDISTILVRANGMHGTLLSARGPRTAYLAAANLVTIYLHLLDRARRSDRADDRTLMQRNSWGRVGPWAPDRPKSVEEIPPFTREAIAEWNAILAEEAPPEYRPEPRGRRRAAPHPAASASRSAATAPQRSPGLHPGSTVDLPFGLQGIVNPGGPNARLVYSIIKTPEMTMTTEAGKLEILAAVIARILRLKYNEQFYMQAARELMELEFDPSVGVLYTNAPPEAFEKLSPSLDFTFEVGFGFLMSLDRAAGGAVSMEVLRQLEPSTEVKGPEPTPLWRELYPLATRREKSYWIWKRIQSAAPLYDPTLRRPQPGRFYKGNGMIYVSDGAAAGDQIWITPDLRIYHVNERALMIDAFREGVVRAGGAVTLAYTLIGLSLTLIEAPAMISSLHRLRFPYQLARQFIQTVRSRPLTLLGEIAFDQSLSLALSGGWDNYVKDLSSAEGCLDLFFTIVGATRTDLHLPGKRLRVRDGELSVLPPGSAKTALAPPGRAAADTPAKTSPPPEASRVVIRPEAAPGARSPASRANAELPAARAGQPGAAAAKPAGAKGRGGDTGSVADRKITDQDRAVGREQRGIGDREFEIGGGGGRPRPTTRRDPLGRGGRRSRPRGGEQGRGRSPGWRGGDARGRRPGGRRRGRRGGSAGRNEHIVFTSGGVRYRLTVSPEARRAYDAIPVGDTVVYTVHDRSGNVIYVGETTKLEKRPPLERLKEHLYTKEVEFVGEAAELRLRGHYDYDSARALEHELVREHQPYHFNKDQEPYLTHQRGPDPDRMGVRRRYQDEPELDFEPRSVRRRPTPETEPGEIVPSLNLDIRFKIDFD